MSDLQGTRFDINGQDLPNERMPGSIFIFLTFISLAATKYRCRQKG